MNGRDRGQIIAGLAYLTGAAMGYDEDARRRLAEEWGNTGPSLDNLALIAPTQLGGTVDWHWTDRDVAAQAGWAMRQAARALEAAGWRSDDLARRLKSRTAPAANARTEEKVRLAREALQLQRAGKSVDEISKTIGRSFGRTEKLLAIARKELGPSEG